MSGERTLHTMATTPDRPVSAPPVVSGIEVPPSSELAALYAHSTTGFAVFDRDLRYLRINPALAAINGFQVADHLGRTVSELVPALEAQARVAVEHVFRTGRPFQDADLTGQTPAAPDVTRTWHTDWYPIAGRDGEVVAVVVAVEETTEIRALERENRRVTAALAASEARHQFLLRLHDQIRQFSDPVELAYRACRMLGEQLDLVRVGFAELDDDGRTVVVRRPYTNGVDYAEGRFDATDYGADLLEALHDGLTRVYPDVAGDAELSAAEKASHERWSTRALVVVPVFEEGRLRGMFYANADAVRDWSADEVALIEAVAERTYDAMLRARAAAQLRESEHRLRLAQEAARIGIYDYDLVTGEMRWDERVRELWGVAPGVPLTRRFLCSFVPAEEIAEMDAAIERATDPAGDGTLSVEYTVHRADGRSLRILATGLATFRDGRAIRLVGTLQDLTALRAAEMALREADRRKDEFLAMLAHELRNPMAPLRNALWVMGRAELPERLRPPLEMASRQVRHMSRLVDDLLEVSRITRGLIRVKPERVLLQQSLFSVAEGLAPTLDERRQRLEFDLPRTQLWVRADPLRLAQVVENLLTNASKYSDAESVITVRAHERAGDVVVEVTDRGIGISPENLEKVFELFTQVDSTIDRSRGGLGIGLALVRRLVEAHGGCARASSEGRGRGSTFEVTFPVSPAASGEAVPD